MLDHEPEAEDPAGLVRRKLGLQERYERELSHRPPYRGDRGTGHRDGERTRGREKEEAGAEDQARGEDRRQLPLDVDASDDEISHDVPRSVRADEVPGPRDPGRQLARREERAPHLESGRPGRVHEEEAGERPRGRSVRQGEPERVADVRRDASSCGRARAARRSLRVAFHANRGPSARSAAPEAQKLSASMRKKAPTETTAASAPARLGPTVRAIRRVASMSPLVAWSSPGCATSAGMAARSAGVNSASNVPRTIAAITSGATPSEPRSAKTASTPTGDRARDVGDDHRPAPVEAIRDDSAQGRERKRGPRLRRRHEPRGAPGELRGGPHHRDEVEVIPERRQALSDPKDGDVPPSEHRQPAHEVPPTHVGALRARRLSGDAYHASATDRVS